MAAEKDQALSMLRKAFSISSLNGGEAEREWERERAEEVFKTLSIPAAVPREYFSGIQKPQEYQRGQEHRVKTFLAQGGIRFLEDNPVKAVVIPLRDDRTTIALLDGHKRVRYAPILGAQPIPTRLVDADTLATAWGMSMRSFTERFVNEISSADAWFAQRASAQGKVLPSTQTIPMSVRARDIPNFFANHLVAPNPTREVPVFVAHHRR